MRIFSHAERPELRELREAAVGDAWDAFMHEDPVANEHWDTQYEQFPDLQLYLVGDDGAYLAESNAVPIPFGPDALPEDGWDAAMAQAFEGRPGVAVSAIAITVAREHQGKGLSEVMLAAMRKAALARGVADLVAPVRPSLKHRYPLAPMERYVEWRREDGALFDPWLRVHERAGAELVGVAPRSMRIPGTVAEWEQWTGMAFPETGPYVVPGALVPVEIDVERDEGVYVEPNVWLRHRL